jgi:hypothetical protein
LKTDWFSKSTGPVLSKTTKTESVLSKTTKAGPVLLVFKTLAEPACPVLF